MIRNNLKTSELVNIIKASSFDEFTKLKEAFSIDERKAVQAALASRQKKLEKDIRLEQQHEARKKYEYALHKSGFKLVAGIDEVGRGPLAGPVYAAAVILDPNVDIFGIKDSKKLDEMKREKLAAQIHEKCLACSIGIATEQEIDTLNILNATKLAMRRAVEQLPIKPDYLLIDALKLDQHSIPQLAIVKGDDLSISIGAASIIAKVARDRFMRLLSAEFPEYCFEKNKGYGTQEHIDALRKHGPVSVHRLSFIQNLI